MMNFKSVFFITLGLFTYTFAQGQNKDPLATQIVTTDLGNFWEALDKAGTEVKPEVLDQLYIKRGSKGVKAFTNGRIKNAAHLADVIRSHAKYYHSIKTSTDSVNG